MINDAYRLKNVNYNRLHQSFCRRTPILFTTVAVIIGKSRYSIIRRVFMRTGDNKKFSYYQKKQKSIITIYDKSFRQETN